MKKEKENILSDAGTERAILSILAQNGSDAFYDIADLISCSAFTNENNQAIFKCIEKIIEKKQEIDIPTIISQAEEMNLGFLICKEKEDLEYLRALYSFSASKLNAREHAKKLAKLEIAREARLKHFEAIKDLSGITGSESIDTIVGISEKPIFDLVTKLNHGREDAPKNLGDNIEAYLDFLENNEGNSIGIPLPFPILNEVIGGGIRRGGVSLIVARAKQGKSTIGICSAIDLSQQGVPILYLDTEMTLEEQFPRIIANMNEIPIKQIEDGSFLKNKLLRTRTIERIKQLPFEHKVVSGKPFEEILSIIRRWILQNVGYENGRVKNCLVIYDYFKIMDTNELNDLQEYQAIGFQIGRLVDFCKEYDFPCLAFTQANRDGITKESSDVISQSDRLLWLCQSAILFKRKTSEEIMEDGRENGNVKLKPLECRFGPGIEDDNYINVQADRDMFRMREINTRFDVLKQKKNKENGFEEDVKDLDF